jgi:hypothetical protein
VRDGWSRGGYGEAARSSRLGGRTDAKAVAAQVSQPHHRITQQQALVNPRTHLRPRVRPKYRSAPTHCRTQEDEADDEDGPLSEPSPSSAVRIRVCGLGIVRT